MGSCYLIAAICLQRAQSDESKERIVCSVAFPLSSVIET